MKINALQLLEEVKVEAVKNNKNTRKEKLQNIATIYGVESTVLQTVYKAIQMVQGVELKSAWNDTENEALLKMMSKVEGVMTKGKVYEFFGTLVNRTGSSVQQQYSKLVREMQKQDPVNSIHMEEGEVQHNAPQLGNMNNKLVDALVGMLDAFDKHGYESEEAVQTMANGVTIALEGQKETPNPIRLDFLKENRELKQQVTDLEFQYQELFKSFNIVQKQLEKEKEKRHSLEGEMWNLQKLTGADQIRQLQKINRYVVDKSGLASTKEAK